MTDRLPEGISRALSEAADALVPRPGGNPAAVAISFYGGDYVVPTAGLTEAVSVARHLLPAFFLGQEAPPKPLRTAALRLAAGVLRLADHVGNAVGLDRLGTVEPRPRHDVATRLTLSSAQLDAVAGSARSAIERLVASGPAAPSWAATPLFRQGDTYALVGADLLLITLRHHLLLLAEEHGWLPALSERLANAYDMSVDRALMRLGWTYADLSFDDETVAAKHDVWRFDIDAAAIVTLLSDDLSDYDEDDPDTRWDVERHVDVIAAHGEELAKSLLCGSGSPDRVLHLVVLAGVGRPSAWFDEAEDVVTGLRRLSFYAGDLEAIGVAERGDPLTLWRYVLDTERLGCRVMANDPLETFALWRSEDHSFYLGDDRRPTLITSEGRAERLRTEVARRLDRHGMPGPVDRGLVEVVRRFEEFECPLYRSPAVRDGVGVDVDGVHVWVLAEQADDVSGMLVDAVAYWMWQIAGDLEPGRLTIALSIGGEGTIQVEELEAGHLRLMLDPRKIPAFLRPDNEGERLLVRALISALMEGAEDRHVDEVIERVAPLGLKKMLLLFGPNADLALDSQKLPSARSPLRESDEAEAMDELGEYLRRTRNRAVGPVASDDRVGLLWDAVTFHLDQLTSLISTLDPDGVLETLTAANERLLNRGAFDRYIIPTRLACFGATTDIVGPLRNGFERHASASSALRFVIECVAADPPRGIRPMTLAVQDRLVALAAQVIGRGSVSDTIREGLDDTRLSMLASGRLGVSREGRFYAGRERFADRFMDAQVERSHLHFPSLWDEGDADADATADAALLDAAAPHEWGMSLTNILEFFDALVHFSDREPAAVIGVDEAVGMLVADLEWEEAKVHTALGHFSLSTRERLLEPEAPFGASDVLPWRYSRRLSLIRRPIVLRPTPDGVELVYGFRAVHSAGRMIFDDISHARLKATSLEMKQAIGAIRQKDDDRFNEQVAELYANVPGLVVEQQVDTIAGSRIARPNRDVLGDVDVLVLDPVAHVIYAVEVKNLAAGRTPIEIAREFKRTFKSEASKPAAIDRHVERVAWLTEHRDRVVAAFGQDTGAEWTVEGSIVVNAEVAASFLEELPMPVYDIRQLAEMLDTRRLR